MDIEHKCECGKEATKHIQADIDLPVLHMCEECYMKFLIEWHSIGDDFLLTK